MATLGMFPWLDELPVDTHTHTHITHTQTLRFIHNYKAHAVNLKIYAIKYLQEKFAVGNILRFIFVTLYNFKNALNNKVL